MSGETSVTIQGNLTSDPELRYTQNGLAVANFTIASTPKVWDKQANQSKDGEALFMRCSVWRDFAENVAGSLTKGARVVAVGQLKQRSYETKEGEKRTSIELDIEAIGPDLRFATALVTRSNSDRRSGGQQTAPQQSQAPADAGNQSGAQTGAGDVWNSPAEFKDEIPW